MPEVGSGDCLSDRTTNAFQRGVQNHEFGRWTNDNMRRWRRERMADFLEKTTLRPRMA